MISCKFAHACNLNWCIAIINDNTAGGQDEVDRVVELIQDRSMFNVEATCSSVMSIHFVVSIRALTLLVVVTEQAYSNVGEP